MSASKRRTVDLRDIAEVITSGATPRVGELEFYSGKETGVPFFRIQNIVPNSLDLTDLKYISREVHESGLKRSQVRPGDVLMTITGRLGTAAVVPNDLREANINQHICLIRLDCTLADPEYVAFHLNSHSTHEEIIRKQHGSTRIALNHRNVGTLQISLPSLAEQKRTASVLSMARRLASLRSQANLIADTILQSVFLRMFGDPVANPMAWTIGKVGELTEVQTGGTPDRQKKEYFGGGIPWVTTTQANDYVVESTPETISEQGLAHSNAKILPRQTVLLAMIGAGRTRGLSTILNIEAATNQNFAAILPSDKLNPFYLWQLFKLSYAYVRSLGRGVNQPALNLEIVRSLEVPVPPLSLQERYARVVDRMLALKRKQMQSSGEISGLIDALMNNAFREQPKPRSAG